MIIEPTNYCVIIIDYSEMHQAFSPPWTDALTTLRSLNEAYWAN